MIADADRLDSIDLTTMSDDELADAIEHRAEVFERWHDVYWQDFIPFAHGARLFGQIYNDAVRPDDAYEFIDLLSAQPMVSMERNRLLEEMAALIRERDLADALASGDEPPDDLQKMLADYGRRFSDPAAPERDPAQILDLVVQMARRERAQSERQDVGELEEHFLAQFDEGPERDRAERMLDLGRVSYRLRDDDNIYLGRVEAQLNRAVTEARRRIEHRIPEAISAEDAAHALRDRDFVPEEEVVEAETAAPEPGPRAQERQLTGQPAGEGLARGPARVIRDEDDLYDFKSGEVLVVDSLDPTMTFVVPLAEAIVERRGGMLIHGAIIAREYGIACVTGVPQAAALIRTGDEITVDGYLGIVTISKPADTTATTQ
jgi:pyruvate,water dikinase